MKTIANIAMIVGILFCLGMFDNIKFPSFETVIVEIVQPSEFLEETKLAASKVPESAKIDLAVFNDEFAKKTISYSGQNISHSYLTSDLYPQSFREVFGTKYSGTLKDYLSELKTVLSTEISTKDKFLTDEEIKKISNIYTAVSWNLINPPKSE